MPIVKMGRTEGYLACCIFRHYADYSDTSQEKPEQTLKTGYKQVITNQRVALI